MKYNLQWAKEQQNIEILPFWGHTSKSEKIGKHCLSQWYPCNFTVDGIQYHTAEQYMMAQKALLFNDQEIYQQIMKANNPKDYKALGRKIHNFNPETWNIHKFDIVVTGNKAKFSQNTDLKEFLLSTGNKILVEASPYDNIWGVKLRPNDSRVQNPNLWQGENLLGFALMEVRDSL